MVGRQRRSGLDKSNNLAVAINVLIIEGVEVQQVALQKIKLNKIR